MKAFIAPFFFLVAMALAVSPLFAQPLQCAAFDQMMTHLTDTYGEQLIGEGHGPNGTRLLMFAHPEGDTWTVVGVMPGGQACFIASGANWTVHDFTPAGSET